MLAEGDRIAEWVVLRRLGAGGMGAVYLCRHGLSERLMAAVKVHKGANVNRAAQTRFLREVEAMVALRHPAVVRVLGFGMDPVRELLYVAMEPVEGEDLGKRIKTAPLPPDVAAAVFRQVADGLAHAHRKGIFHRDIKPANLMIGAEGQAIVIDFGIAVDDTAERLTGQGEFVGTPEYLPPEALEFESARPDRIDVYALGVTLYESLVGRVAFKRTPGAHFVQQVGALRAAKEQGGPLDPGEGFPSSLREVVRRATHPDPEQRLPDMQSFARLLGAPEPESARTTLPRRSGAGDARDRVGAALFAVGVALTAGGAVVLVGLGAYGLGGGFSGPASSGAVTEAAPEEGLASGGGAPAAANPPSGTPDPAGAPPNASSGDAPAPGEAAPATGGAGAPTAAGTDASTVAPPGTASAPQEDAGSAKPPTAGGTGRPRAAPTSPTSGPATVTPASSASNAAASASPAGEPVVPQLPVTISSAPLGARVFVDGVARGTTPLVGLMLPIGAHRVRLEGDGASIEREIQVARRGATRFVWKGGETWESGF